MGRKEIRVGKGINTGHNIVMQWQNMTDEEYLITSSATFTSAANVRAVFKFPKENGQFYHVVTYVLFNGWFDSFYEDKCNERL